jgi:hypothetical protein
MHGKDPSTLIHRVVEKEGIERLAVLGDLDTPDVLKSIRESVKSLNLDFIYTVGNHEYNYVRHWGISSENMVKEIKVPRNGKLENALHTKSADEYFSEWDEESEQKDFVLTASINRGLDSKRYGLIVPKKEIIYAHASLVEATPVDRENPDFIWGRLLHDKKKLISNFEAMSNLGDFKLFFRGHDHIPSLRFTSDGQDIKYLDHANGIHKLDLKNTRSIVTVGGFIYGHYTIYNPKSQEIDFRRLKVEDRTKMKVYNF